MNLSKLFKIQKQLDERIVKEKGLVGHDLLDKKVLALQVELAECAQESRCFKFWSNDQEPNIRYCHACNGQGYFNTGLIEEGMPYYEGCAYCQGTGWEENRVLEEYVDSLHFILSIGLDINIDFEIDDWALHGKLYHTIIEQFLALNRKILNYYEKPCDFTYVVMFKCFIGLGEMLGFTWDEIEQSYLEKNKINHERLESGY